MADNILKGIVRVEAPGLEQTANKVATSAAKMQQSIKAIAPAANSANLALMNTGRVIQDLPFGFLGIANNLNPLLESFQATVRATGSTSAAFKALGSSMLGAGGLGFAISLVSSALILFGDRIFGLGKAAKEAKTAADQLKEAVTGIFKEVSKEATEVSSLVAVLRNETETRERKLSAIKELQRIQPDIFNGITLEGQAVIGLDNAYKNYLESLKVVIAAKIKQAQLEQLIGELLRKQGITLVGIERDLAEGTKRFQEALLGIAKSSDAFNPLAEGIKKSRKTADAELDAIERNIEKLIGEISELSKGIKLPPLKVKVDKIELPGRPELEKIALQVQLIANPGNFKEISNAFTDGLNKRLKDALSKDFLPDFENVGKGAFSRFGAGFAEEFVKQFVKRANELFKSGKNALSSFNQALTETVLKATAFQILSEQFSVFVDAVANGENVFRAFGQFVTNTLKQIIAQLIKTIAIAGLLSIITGGAANGGLSFMGALSKVLGGSANPGIGGAGSIASSGSFGAGGRMAIDVNIAGITRGSNIAWSANRTLRGLGRAG